MAILRERKVWKREAAPAYERPFARAEVLKGYEQRNVLRAMAVLRLRCGSWAKLARVLGVHKKAVSRVRTGETKPHGGLAVRVARAAGVPVDEILNGKFVRRGTCPWCGRRAAFIAATGTKNDGAKPIANRAAPPRDHLRRGLPASG